MNNQFSIIIPVYNLNPCLHKCISSAIYQNYEDYEIIIIDDGSTDDIFEFLKINNFIEHISYFKINNSGVEYARKYGIEHSKNKWLIFLDSDDYLDKNLLSKINANISDGIDGIMYNYKIFKNEEIIESSEILNDKFMEWKKIFIEFEYGKYIASLWRFCFPKKFYENLELTDLKFCEDFIWIQNVLLKYKPNIICLNEALYFYNKSNINSASSNKYNKKYLQSYIDLPLQFERIISKNADRSNFKNEISRENIVSLQRISRILKYKDFKKYILNNLGRYSELKINKNLCEKKIIISEKLLKYKMYYIFYVLNRIKK